MDHCTLMRGGWVLSAALLCTGASQAVAGAWTQPRGQLWLKAGATFGFADEKFANDQVDAIKFFPDGRRVQAGDEIPFDFTTGGSYRFQTYSLQGAYGITDRVEITATTPFVHTRFENDNDEVEPGSGIGDLRLGLGVQVLKTERGVVAFSGEWKAPTADVPRSVYAQPLGEGQHDFTAWVHGGWSLWPLGWAQVGVGHRWRLRNTELEFNPGNEWHFTGEFGWQVRPTVALKAAIEGLEGDVWTAEAFGLLQEIATRRLWSAAPALIVRLDRWGATDSYLEVGASIALAGEELPVGRELRLAWMTNFGG